MPRLLRSRGLKFINKEVLCNIHCMTAILFETQLSYVLDGPRVVRSLGLVCGLTCEVSVKRAAHSHVYLGCVVLYGRVAEDICM